MRLASLVLIASLALAACSHAPGGIAPSTTPVAPGGYKVLKTDVEGSDCLVSLLMIVPLSNGNTTHEAIADAIKQVPGANALIDVSSDSYSQIWILWRNTCTVVHGSAVAVN
jgi:hypothetical protein